MFERAIVKRINIPPGTRVICVSDIHGSLELFRRLLAKVEFCESDILLLLGDLYTKGSQPLETLSYIVDLCERNPNVHAIRGNCDWVENDFDEEEQEWLATVAKLPSVLLQEREAQFVRELPHIIDAGDYVFVHSGLEEAPLEAQDAYKVQKMDDFIYPGTAAFERWVVVGHMPTVNFCWEIPSNNPIVYEERRIIAIDGGNVVKGSGGQLNAFIIRDGEFSYEAVDALEEINAERDQEANEDVYNVTWFNRFAERIEGSETGEFCRVRLLDPGREIELPNDMLWTDKWGNLCVGEATNYALPVKKGEKVSLIRRYSDRILAKKDGIQGWIYINQNEGDYVVE